MNVTIYIYISFLVFYSNKIKDNFLKKKDLMSSIIFKLLRLINNNIIFSDIYITKVLQLLKTLGYRVVCSSVSDSVFYYLLEKDDWKCLNYPIHLIKTKVQFLINSITSEFKIQNLIFVFFYVHKIDLHIFEISNKKIGKKCNFDKNHNLYLS